MVVIAEVASLGVTGSDGADGLRGAKTGREVAGTEVPKVGEAMAVAARLKPCPGGSVAPHRQFLWPEPVEIMTEGGRQIPFAVGEMEENGGALAWLNLTTTR